MRPLSNALYLARNKRRVIPVVFIVILAVIAVSIIGVTGKSQFLGYEIAWGEPFKHYALVAFTNDQAAAAIGDEMRQRDDIERLIPAQLSYLRVPSLLGSITTSVLGLAPSDLGWFMEQTELTLEAGRLPVADQPEIVLHQSILRARDLKIGDIIGNSVDNRELLKGRWEIVGVIDGPVQTNVVPYDQFILQFGADLMTISDSYLVFPADGQMETVDEFIREIPSRDAQRLTFESQQTVLQTEFDSALMVIWVIDIVTIIVMSLATGLLNTIYFMQRMHEYGTLAALGYSVRFLIRRTLTEAMLLTVLAWSLGLLLAYGLTLILRAVVFEPRGYLLAGIDGQTIAFTLPIPIMIGLFSFFTVIRQFRRLDPVVIVEGKD